MEADPKGYTDAGKPELTRAHKQRQLGDAGLLGSEGMENSENTQVTGKDVGGFLRRNNYGDRF